MPTLTASDPGTKPPPSAPRASLADFTPFLIVAAGLTLAFGYPLYQLFRFAAQSNLYSHIPLIPLVSAYLIWTLRKSIPAPTRSRPVLGWALLGAGLLATLGWLATDLPRDDAFALSAGGFLLLLTGAAALLLGTALLRVVAFPVGFLVFMVPMPTFLFDLVTEVLQHGSADAAHGIFFFSSTTLFRDGLVFHLPNFTMQVAPECSGIHSTLALFITSTVAGWFFLRSPWLRIILVAAVLPLALVRNGFRVWVIGELCVRVSPDMIHSYIHRQGGPIFFALSLIPFSALLFLLVKIDRRHRTVSPASTTA